MLAVRVEPVEEVGGLKSLTEVFGVGAVEGGGEDTVKGGRGVGEKHSSVHRGETEGRVVILFATADAIGNIVGSVVQRMATSLGCGVTLDLGDGDGVASSSPVFEVGHYPGPEASSRGEWVRVRLTRAEDGGPDGAETLHDSQVVDEEVKVLDREREGICRSQCLRDVDPRVARCGLVDDATDAAEVGV